MKKNKQKSIPGPRFNSGLFGLVKVGSFAPSRVDPLEIKKIILLNTIFFEN